MTTHLAILKKPYLNLILTGQKTIECRLTRIPCLPFNKIASGDRIVLKQSSGPIRATALAQDVRFWSELTPETIIQIQQQYNDAILGADDFWLSRHDCRYCTLIWLDKVTPCTPRPLKRTGMQAWAKLPDDFISQLSDNPHCQPSVKPIR